MKRYTDQVLSVVTGLILRGAQVSVFQAGTQILAPIYSADTVNPPLMQNPFFTASGTFTFFAEDGSYDILVRVGGRTRLLPDVDIVDLAELARRLSAVEDGTPGAPGSLRADLAAAAGGQIVGFSQDGLTVSDMLKEMRRWVWAEQFGFSSTNSGAANRTALQRAVDAVYARGGGLIRAGSGTFAIDGYVSWKPGCAFKGLGSKVTALQQVNVSPQTIRHGFEGIGGGLVGFKGFAVIGRGQANDLPSFYDEKAINIGRTDDTSGRDGVERAEFNDVEIAYSRGMCIGAQGKVIIANGCYLHHSFRDGFNFSGSKYVEVQGNIAERIADDAIAVHVVRGQVGIIDTEIRIIGNRCERALGIKGLGARNTVVSNNTLRLCAAYSIEVDADPSTVSGEGIGAKFGLTITSNSIIDPLNAGQIGLAGLSTAIQLGGVAAQGVLDALDGRYSAMAGKIVTPEMAYINENDPAKARPANRSIVIGDNTIIATLPAAAKFSDLGFGKLWSPAGEIDPAPFSGTIGAVRAISLDGDFRNVAVTGNTIDGMDAAVSCSGRKIMDGIEISGNAVTRCNNFVAVANAELLHGTIAVSDNIVNLDPYAEQSGRNLDTGGWTDFNGLRGAAVIAQNHIGISMTGNTLSNLREPVQGAHARRVHVADNKLLWDWSVPGQRRGIGYPDDCIYGNKHFFQYSAPKDANFGKFSDQADSAFVVFAPAMPTSGYFVKGHLVINSGATVITNGRRLHGWRRVTTSNAHVLNTDWFEVYE